MTTLCHKCDHGDMAPPTAWRFLRRGILLAVIVSAAIAIVLGEAWVIERAPALFAAHGAVPTVESKRGPADALASDAMPIAVLH